MKRLISVLLVVMVFACSLQAFAAPWDIEYGAVVSSPELKEMIKEAQRSESSLIYPSEGHPRVYLNDEYIAFLKANKDSDVYKSNYSYLLSVANKELPEQPEGGLLSTAISNQLVARALMYALGEVPKSHAKETADYAIAYLANPATSAKDSISIYKDYGTNGIQTGALVFDWCYSAMNASQRAQLSEEVRDLMYAKDQPCRPDNIATGWSDIAGKSVGQPLIYNSIAAVAIYDEYPEIYEAIMPKIQGTMADIVRTFGQAGALTDGSISYTREYYSYYVGLLFDRMGYPDFYGDQSKVGYKMLYSRLPYGALIAQGDDFKALNYTMGKYINGSETNDDMALLSVMHNDPYLRFQYVKENPSPSGWENLLLKASDIEPELPDDLPLAYYIDDPKSEIIARTSWQDGLDSNTAVGLISMHNRRSGDHDHGHMGEFQLYYKGPLTMPGGEYQGKGGGYGEPHHYEYYQRTISSNCVTVYMPGEVFTRASSILTANDGGQKTVTSKTGGLVISQYADQMADDNHLAITEAHYIGPNEKTPAFSYIKGDLTNAYTKEKMAGYKRSMVFMDTFNETYPAALVVFDRVVSTNENYQKKWLLQSVTEPTVTDNKITIVNTEDGANGKLVNTTLLPESVNIEKVGEVGKYIVDGKEYPSETNSINTYKGGIRLEVSPKKASQEDTFLNAMYVTDADGNAAELPMLKEENDLFVGVTTLDRMVMFAKSGERVNEEFELKVRDNGYDEMLCLVTDLEAGKWCIEGEGKKTVIEANDEAYSITFSAKPGDYKIYPAEETAEAEILEYPEMEKEKIGDFAIKLGTQYAYVKNPNKLVDGTPYFAVADFSERYLGTTTEQNGDTLTITTSDGAVITITAGDASYSYTKSTINRKGTMAAAPFMENGVMYVTHKGISTDLGMSAAGWTPHTKVLKCSAADKSNAKPLEGVDESRVLQPTLITSSSDDGNSPENLIDRDLGTRWSSIQGDGEWACFDLGEAKEMSEVLIAFYNGDKRNWKFDIQISDDGATFTNVITGARSSGNTTGVESFKLPDGTKARYIRYYGHGEEVTKTFYNSVTEFIIMK